MNQVQYQLVKKIFQSAIELAPSERAAFLDRVCDDDILRRDVELLLVSFEGKIFEKPLTKQTTEQIFEEEIAAGQKLGQYEIRKKIGAGGMGEVFLALDTKLNRQVAIKLLLPNANLDPRAEKRLLREAQSVAALDHPNICTVYEVGELSGRPFIVMQYVDGETLAARIKRERVSIRESLGIILSVADALAEAHGRGIIHRDIKPSNIIISTRGLVKVLDFSLAKKISFNNDELTQSLLTQAGVIAGTIAYMSPEQARGHETDARSDIWSLGVVLYELLTGRLPFEGETKSDIIVAILRNEPAPLGNFIENLPVEFKKIFDKVFEKNRDLRYQSVEEFCEALRQLQQRIEDGNFNEFELRDFSAKQFTRQNTRSLPKISTKDSFEVTKLTNSDVNFITNENEVQVSVEYAAPKNKKLKVVLYGLVLALFSGVLVWQVVPFNDSSKKNPFTASTRSDLLMTSLYNTKRKPGGTVSSLNFSPNGDLLAFTQSGGGKSSICVKQITGGDSVKLTDGKWLDTNPIWSPDGQRIAFLSNRNNTRGIWAVSYLGGTPVLLKEIELPQGAGLKKWSKDNNKIYYDLNFLLYALDLTTGESTQITSDPKYTQIAISPDEEMIAYVAVESDKEQIWIQPLRGGERRLVSKNNGHNRYPVWFPENHCLGYSSDQNGNYQIYVTNLKTDETSQITFGGSDTEKLAVAPDGKKIAFVRVSDEANIYSYNLETKRETAQTDNTEMQIFPDVSPDGKNLIYQSTRLLTKVHTSVIKMKGFNEGSESITISESGGVAKWSPDGKKIGFVRAVGNVMNLLTVNANGQNEKQLTTEGIYTDGIALSPFYTLGNYFSWSPDSSRLAFCRLKNDAVNLWTQNADGSDEKMWTQNADVKLKIDSPFWSPDGDRITFVTRTQPANYDSKRQYGIAIAGGGQTKNLFTSEEQIKILGWSAAGTKIFIAAKNKNEISLFEISTASGEKLKQLTRISDANLYSFVLSKSGKEIAYTAQTEGVDNVYMFSVENSASHQITSNSDSTIYFSGLTWTADGKTLLYSKQTGGMQISMITNPK